MIIIVDYGMGNLHSVHKAFELMGADVTLSSRKEDLENASGIVLPGVGAFGQGMHNLAKLDLIDTIKEQILIKNKPFLGICLGMQLLATKSEEFGNHQGLNIIPTTITKFPSSDDLRIPHVGWNNITIIKDNPLLQGIKQDTDVYFVHSFCMKANDENFPIATCTYGDTFTAALQKGNIFGTQFHPEKSQDTGLQIIENFASYVNEQKDKT